MDSKGGSFRQKKVYFSQVSNSALRDNKLSLKAKGLYSLIQSYITIEGFILYKATLKKDCNEGETAFESAWSELKRAGYLVQYKHQTSNGVFIYEYELLDTLQPHPQNLPPGKVGVYSNTDINNTDNVDKAYRPKIKRKSTKRNKSEYSDYALNATVEIARVINNM